MGYPRNKSNKQYLYLFILQILELEKDTKELEVEVTENFSREK